MLASAALNIPIVILDVGQDCSAKQVIQPLLEHVDGSFADPIKIKELAEKVDVLTIEIEHVDAVLGAFQGDRCHGGQGGGRRSEIACSGDYPQRPHLSPRFRTTQMRLGEEHAK